MALEDKLAGHGLQEGALVLADISGYSKFIAQTEVDHSWSILRELLDTMVRVVEIVTMRVVSLVPEKELTLVADKPTTA